jgi:4-hydroxy-4-methyl-2-oxoglutarate aldolase
LNETDVRDARQLGSATLHEAAGRIGAVRSDIGPVSSSMALAGPASTVRTTSGDNLWIHRALYAARPGEVLVVATGDTRAEWGYWGEILSVAARERGLAGLVLEGGSRDHGRLETCGFPVFSLGPCIRGTVKNPASPGQVNEVVGIGDMFVSPGDLVVGDRDGVVVIPSSQASAVIAAGREREDKESLMMDQLRAGRTTIDLLGLDAIGERST